MRRPACLAAFAALVLAALPGAAAAMADPAARVVARSEAAGVGHATVEGMLTLLEEAAAEGLPAEPLVAKYLEGLSKSVAEPRILAAVRTVRARLARALALLEEAVAAGAEGPVRSADVVRVASGLTAGVPEAEIRQLVEAAAEAGAPVSRIAVAVAGLESLRGMGIYAPAAAADMADSLSSGRGEADLARVAADHQRLAETWPSGDDTGDWAQEGLSGTDLGHDAGERFGGGQLPDEPSGAAGSLVPGTEGLGDRDEDDEDDPYRPDRDDPRDAFSPDDPDDVRPSIRRP